MESSSQSKRKRRGGGGGEDHPRRPSKPRAAEDDPRVTDDEVEEFFTILRRMRDASSSMAAVAGGGRSDARPAPPPNAGPRWSPAFALEDFMGPDATRGGEAVDGTAKAERVAEEESPAAPRSLDLNADPEPEGVAVESADRDATARCAGSQTLRKFHADAILRSIHTSASS